MVILYELADHGGPRKTWRINQGCMTRNKTALRKVTNRKLRRKLYLKAVSHEPY